MTAKVYQPDPEFEQRVKKGYCYFCLLVLFLIVLID